ncbi:DUF2939 domain-containing protein [Aurantiacibacter luteus]|uniref:DUF2939 domain-containing protein n=1 Tax=Aurantiacibacter luteus TaxID=1581420 RepID=A0A0G9MXF6_9SPHN|nr:DUF2939 domain-containing protein [Aurantiacibacter luteus]KLE35239.1 hypothetical protein AAW00_01820 [Aurantiacibacter luteus]
MRKLLVLAVILLALFAGWYFASPWWAMRSLADAARSGDVAALEGKVDFPAVRRSAREQLGELVGQQRERGGLFGMVPDAIVDRAGREVIDRAVNADSLGTLVATGAMAAPFLPERLRTQAITWDVERDDFDHFRGVGTFADGTPGPQLLFRREGAGWLVTGFKLPPL